MDFIFDVYDRVAADQKVAYVGTLNKEEIAFLCNHSKISWFFFIRYYGLKFSFLSYCKVILTIFYTYSGIFRNYVQQPLKTDRYTIATIAKIVMKLLHFHPLITAVLLGYFVT